VQPPSALVCTLLIKSSAMACGRAQCRHPRLSLRIMVRVCCGRQRSSVVALRSVGVFAYGGSYVTGHS
jgi:hypothetical protein